MKPLLFRDIAPRIVSIPPVTGVYNSNLPFANRFDSSRTFRDRSDSAPKRKRRDGQDELLDAVYDLTNDFPPVNQPDRPSLDVAAIKSILVEATAMSENLKPILSREDASQDSKSIVAMLCSLVGLVGTLVEKGIEPLSAAVVGVSGAPTGRGYAAAARRLLVPPQPPQRVEPGRKELEDALKKAETEAVLFGANLGVAEIAHRGTLNACLTADLKRRAEGMAADGSRGGVEESLRVVEDALSCVDNLEFLGQRSKAYKAPGGGDSGFCSMPVKLVFPDKDTRFNFEKTIRTHTGLRVSQSLPKVIRDQMAAFRKALEARYEERIIMVRPDPKSMEFVGFQKQDGVGSWTKCQESFPIPSGILLADYTLIKTFDHFWDAEGEGAVGGVAGGGMLVDE